MHRQTPLTASFMGYTGAGSRTLIDTIDDGKLMQQMKGLIMNGESRSGVESPQNYGFTSVVRAATKDAMGMIKDCAEGFMSFHGGSRGGSFCGIMDDRRYRPLHLKEGENSQYDDLGQMTLLRRTGLYLLSLDSEDDSQKQGQSGQGQGKDASGGSGSGGGGQKVQRMVSLRHVEKSKQERPSRGGGDQSTGGGGGSGGGGGGTAGTAGVAGRILKPGEYASGNDQQSKDYKHEGESVNHEVRVTKGKVEFYSGDSAVGYYDKASTTWIHMAGGDATKSVKVDGKHAHIKIGNNSVWVDSSGCWSSTEIQIKADPQSANPPGPTISERLKQLEARVAALEERLANA
jgi:hypothetical protein